MPRGAAPAAKKVLTRRIASRLSCRLVNAASQCTGTTEALKALRVSRVRVTGVPGSKVISFVSSGAFTASSGPTVSRTTLANAPHARCAAWRFLSVAFAQSRLAELS